jgi:hypothetical protein
MSLKYFRHVCERNDNTKRLVSSQKVCVTKHMFTAARLFMNQKNVGRYNTQPMGSQ